VDAGSSPNWLSFAVKYEGGPGDIQSVIIRQVSNKNTSDNPKEVSIAICFYEKLEIHM
jgi:hypothetical protein